MGSAAVVLRGSCEGWVSHVILQTHFGLIAGSAGAFLARQGRLGYPWECNGGKMRTHFKPT